MPEKRRAGLFWPKQAVLGNGVSLLSPKEPRPDEYAETFSGFHTFPRRLRAAEKSCRE